MNIAKPWQRIVAYLVDYLVIVLYFGTMSAAYFILRSIGVASSPSYVTLTAKMQGHVVAFLLFTLPVVCYFALSEASARQATIGKRVMRLRVVGTAGQQISRATSFLRSAIKFAPWEIAHVGIWYVLGEPFVSQPGLLSLWAWGISTCCTLCWIISLFVGSRRTPYDWCARTRVVFVPKPN